MACEYVTIFRNLARFNKSIFVSNRQQPTSSKFQAFGTYSMNNLSYQAPMLSEEEHNTPALVGMTELREMNVVIDCRHDMLDFVPLGKEEPIGWPQGTVAGEDSPQ